MDRPVNLYLGAKCRVQGSSPRSLGKLVVGTAISDQKLPRCCPSGSMQERSLMSQLFFVLLCFLLPLPLLKKSINEAFSTELRMNNKTSSPIDWVEDICTLSNFMGKINSTFTLPFFFFFSFWDHFLPYDERI